MEFPLDQRIPMANLHQLLRPALYQRRCMSTGFEALWATSPLNKKSRPRPVHLTPAEAQSTKDSLRELLPAYFREDDRPLDFQGFRPKSARQQELMFEAEQSKRRQAKITEMDLMDEELALIDDDFHLWQWICDRVFQNNDTICQSHNYSLLLNKLFDRLPPHMAMAMFQVVSTISPASFVAGCNSELYVKMIKLRWSAWQDVEGVEVSLKQMINAGLPITWSIDSLVKTMTHAVTADYLKAEEEVNKASGTDIPPEDRKSLIEARRRFVPAERQALKRIEELLLDRFEGDLEYVEDRPKDKDVLDDFFRRRGTRRGSRKDHAWLRSRDMAQYRP